VALLLCLCVRSPSSSFSSSPFCTSLSLSLSCPSVPGGDDDLASGRRPSPLSPAGPLRRRRAPLPGIPARPPPLSLPFPPCETGAPPPPNPTVT
jgi:hypothetical protein